jgi:hypothetical protein
MVLCDLEAADIRAHQHDVSISASEGKLGLRVTECSRNLKSKINYLLIIFLEALL